MPFDFSPDLAAPSARQRRGARSHLTGIAAEEAVCRRYLAAGYDLVARRKRCPEGEIDLLMRLGVQLIAVEVKSSATHDQALDHAGFAQLERVSLACERCMLDMAGDGISDMRLDLALVDAQGRIEVMESFIHY
jgi:putative endonuclease